MLPIKSPFDFQELIAFLGFFSISGCIYKQNMWFYSDSFILSNNFYSQYTIQGININILQ